MVGGGVEFFPGGAGFLLEATSLSLGKRHLPGGTRLGCGSEERTGVRGCSGGCGGEREPLLRQAGRAEPVPVSALQCFAGMVQRAESACGSFASSLLSLWLQVQRSGGSKWQLRSPARPRVVRAAATKPQRVWAEQSQPGCERTDSSQLGLACVRGGI